jgi:hypothetical protein
MPPVLTGAWLVLQRVQAHFNLAMLFRLGRDTPIILAETASNSRRLSLKRSANGFRYKAHSNNSSGVPLGI